VLIWFEDSPKLGSGEPQQKIANRIRNCSERSVIISLKRAFLWSN